MKALPDVHTDFVFGFAVEPLGLTVGVLLACLLAFAVYRVLRW